MTQIKRNLPDGSQVSTDRISEDQSDQLNQPADKAGQRSIPKRLPSLKAGWSWVKLGDVAYYINGRAFKPIEWEAKGLPIIRIQNLNDETADFNYSTKSFEKKYIVENGDLLYAWSASLGTYFWNRGKAWLNQHIFKVLPKEKISKRFLFYTLNFIVDQFYAKTHGSGMVHITKKKFEETEIPLPPLPEQKKIVEKIEELFSQLDSGVASLKKAKEQIKLYRQSVLASAFNGKLISNGNIDGKTGLPDGWKLLPLKNIVVSDRGGLKRGPFGSSIKKSFFVASGYKVYEQGNAIKNDPYRGNYFISEEKYKELESFNVVPGDLIVSCSGVTLGRITEIPSDALPGIINQALLRIRLNKKIVSTKYFIILFRSYLFQKRIFQKSQGTAMPNLVGLKDFKEIDITIPPSNQQMQIVEEIEKRFSEADNLEKAIDESLTKAETLRQSILKQAFKGKLV